VTRKLVFQCFSAPLIGSVIASLALLIVTALNNTRI
jgi:hypothetical protein